MAILMLSDEGASRPPMAYVNLLIRLNAMHLAKGKQADLL